MAVDSAFSNRLSNLKFIGDTLLVSALISLVTLTFDLFTSNLVRYCPWGGGWATFHSYQFSCARDFSFSIYGPTLSYGPRDLVTLTFDLLTLKQIRFIAHEVGNVLPILVLLGLFVLDLWGNNCHVTYV